MKIRILLCLAALVIFGIFIWMRNVSWIDAQSDALPVLAAFPLLVWLSQPWKFQVSSGSWRLRRMAAALALALTGVMVDSTLLLAVSWVLFFDIFQTTFLEIYTRRHLLLPLFGFPWVVQDFPAIGWIFRYSGAAAVEMLLRLSGYSVVREGTLIYIGDLPLSVDPACAGLNVLQAMLVAGSLVICLKVPAGWRFGVATAALFPLAWLANTMRILMLAFAGVTFGPDFAMGWFHQWGGWFVLCVMFVFSQIFFQWLSGDRIRDGVK